MLHENAGALAADTEKRNRLGASLGIQVMYLGVDIQGHSTSHGADARNARNVGGGAGTRRGVVEGGQTTSPF
ncbi:hypothetical protein NPX13_g221 [Xylaria arbuscula]|uniref:Uncharacterized protein n=1 Tax=Xylaria arbuscula TaxID=114810 RepID=A0A9W8NP89_9PEZI|nr:hypothetical protein NPX13_g221 [Xylaria arbuscula]